MADVNLTYTFVNGTEWTSRFTLPSGMTARALRDQFATALADGDPVHIDHTEDDVTAVNPAFLGKVRVETVKG